MMQRCAVVLVLALTVLLSALPGEGGANPGVIPVSQFSGSLPDGGIPEGWTLEKKTGQPVLKMEKDGNAFCLRLVSSGDSSFGIRREARVDVKKYPVLCWRWKAAKLPRGGDIRKSSTDDQALQVYVAFKESGFLGMNTPIVGYIWDNEAPKGWSGRSPQIGADKLRCIVLRNRTDNIGEWYTERRNVYQDYKRLFADINGGEPQSPTTGLQIYINSQRTKSPAEGMVADIYFSSNPSDIVLAEAGKELLTRKTSRISAVPPPVISQKRPAKSVDIVPKDCLRITVEFDVDSITVGGHFHDLMKKVADYIAANKEAKLNIVGNTDNIGSEGYNMTLSLRRAEIVSRYLVEKFGIDPQRLNVKGVGFLYPVADNDTPEGRRKNRNVLISDCPGERF